MFLSCINLRKKNQKRRCYTCQRFSGESVCKNGKSVYFTGYGNDCKDFKKNSLSSSN